jgi:hypothetical protein
MKNPKQSAFRGLNNSQKRKIETREPAERNRQSEPEALADFLQVERTRLAPQAPGNEK